MGRDWKANWDRWYGNAENREKKKAYGRQYYNDADRKPLILEQKKKRLDSQSPEQREDRLEKMRVYNKTRVKSIERE